VPVSRLIAPGAAVLAVLALAATGCADDSDVDAATVGSQTLSADAFVDEVETIAGTEELVEMGLDADGEMLGSYSRDFVDQVLDNRIFFMLFVQVAEEEGIETTDSDRAQAEQYWLSDQTMWGAGYPSFPESYRDQMVEDVATGIAVQTALGDGWQTALIAAADDVEVTPRFGTWDLDTFTSTGTGVLSPDGPQFVAPEVRAAAEEAEAADSSAAGTP
jgi:hypothetical protein